MDNFLFLFLTGGEPFLRDDLPELARIYYTNNKVRKIQIPSNGSLRDGNISLLRKLLDNVPDAHVGATISLDGAGPLHDKNRRVPGLFEKAVATFKEYKKLQKEYPNLGCQINVTVSAFNQDHLLELYDYLTLELKTSNIIYTVVRGEPRDPSAKSLDPEKVKAWNDLIDRNTVRAALGYGGFPFSDMVNIKNLIIHGINIDMLREPRYRMPCYAGRLAAVMFSNGDVHPCELKTERFGNVRDMDYDFKKLWLSPHADAIRKEIARSRCFCTHECFSSTNILFNPRFLPRILGHWLRMKWNANR